MNVKHRVNFPKATLMTPPLSEERKAFFEDIYRQHKAAIYGFLLRQGLTTELAGDVLHDVYYRVIRQNEPLKLESCPKAYLLKVAVNLLRDRSRRAKTSVVLHDRSTEFEPEMAIVDVSPEKQVQFVQQLKLVKQAIQDLTVNQRRIFIMHRFDDMTCREISEEIGMPLRTVERHLSDALAFCQSRLDRQNGVRSE